MEFIKGEDIYSWCRNKGVDVQKTVSILGNFMEIIDEDIVNEVKKMYGIKQPYIVDKWRGVNDEICAILISNDNQLDASVIPANILIEKAPGKKWKVMWPVDRYAEGGEKALIKEDSKGESTSAGCYPNNSQTSEEDSLSNQKIDPQVENVMDKVVSHFERWHYEGGYRRLRIFSGVTPVPTGEESYEVWREAAVQHSEEWRCPEHIKQQRIVESLRGPAMGIIHATRRSNSKSTLKDYFEALDYSFGTLEDVEDLLSKLNQTYQEPNETLTTYIYRLDKILYKLLDKGGINPHEIDERRLKHILRGALTTNPVAQRLRCSLPRVPAPTLGDLIKEVKLEEVQIENREKNLKRVKVIVPTPDVSSVNDQLLKLIEEQNKKLDQLISLQNTPSATSRVSSSGRGRGFSRRPVDNSNITCFKCGQLGHRSFECSQGRSFPSLPATIDRRQPGQSENVEGRSMNPAPTPNP
ncbi:paraneoplastic antigen Ma1 homolog [Pseudophryne corroboree]|uniref:paraneoplastic antigen Ma1 homolog n=1 Tax=Pseudophryne corroboree TaxID=495146 RepID=UPI0030815C5D